FAPGRGRGGPPRQGRAPHELAGRSAVGEVHEVAGVAVMLASAAGGFVTGQNLVVDGGTVISDGQ
ncbi:MAG TPA: SDR family oxidoreductase, partial [Steroidobacteraceae bacterium]|nr:SDR family oxidoreductase [Steroidobacteraceae bacterium]